MYIYSGFIFKGSSVIKRNFSAIRTEGIKSLKIKMDDDVCMYVCLSLKKSRFPKGGGAKTKENQSGVLIQKKERKKKCGCELEGITFRCRWKARKYGRLL